MIRPLLLTICVLFMSNVHARHLLDVRGDDGGGYHDGHTCMVWVRCQNGEVIQCRASAPDDSAVCNGQKPYWVVCNGYDMWGNPTQAVDNCVR